MSPPRRYAAPAFSPCPRASQGACAECVLAAPLVPLVGGRWRAPAAAAMSAEQVSGLCEQLVKAVTVIMDPASTQRYRLEALKVPPGRGERDGGREGAVLRPRGRPVRTAPGRARAWRAGPGRSVRCWEPWWGRRVSPGVLRQGWGCHLLPRCVTACTCPGPPSPSSARSSRRSAPSACPVD